MAEERRFCGNCGTPLVVQDGKIICPNCGTEYAIDWGQEDVARAEVETAQARNQAQLDRDRVISQTREQISQQQQYDSQKRARERASRSKENRLIRFGIVIASFVMVFYLFRACGLVISLNYGSVSNMLSSDKAEQTEAVQTVKVDEKIILDDEDFLTAAYASHVYAIKYMIAREILPEGSDTKLVFTGNYEYEESYLYCMNNGRYELFSVFALEYAPEEGGDNVTIYIPVYFGLDDVLHDGKISSDFKVRQYKGSVGQNGFRDKGEIPDAVAYSWDDINDTISFEMPDNIRSQVSETNGEEGTT